MVNQNLTVDAECFIEPLFVPATALRDIRHGFNADFCETVGFSGTDLPEVRQRSVIP